MTSQARTIRRVRSFERLLKASPLSDREIAEAADVSQSSVYRWKAGDRTPSIGHIRAVADRHDELVNELSEALTTVRRHVGYMQEIEGLSSEPSEM